MSDIDDPNDVGARFMEPVPGGFRFDEVKLTKIKLEPGEVLSVRVFSDDLSEMSLAMLKRQLTSLFPSNRIMLFGMSRNDRMEIEVLAATAAPHEEVSDSGSCAAPTSYCNDCGCGKKERIESSRKD